MDEEHAMVSYPPFLLSQLLEPSSAVICNAMISNSKIYYNNWENIVHHYIYMLFQTMKNQQYISFQNIFHYALMNSTTTSIQIDCIHSTVSAYESPEQFQEAIPNMVQLNQQFVNGDSIALDNLKETNVQDQVCVVKNTSTRNILVFGLESKKERLVIHILCQWANVQGTICYKPIKEEVVKQKVPCSEERVRNITVVICGQQIVDLPSESYLEDDLIIVHKDNFKSFFGVLADAMKRNYVQQFVRINDLQAKEFQRFYKIGPKSAVEILKLRDENGYFKDEKHVEQVLSKKIYNKLLHGTKTQTARTILF